jgi:ABC-type multidrug transport system fused ATPase/permease subunit
MMIQAQYRFVYDELVATSRELYRVYLTSPYTYHLQHNTAIFVRNLSNEVLMAYVNVLLPMLTLLTEAVVAVAILAVLLWVSPLATLVAALTLGGASAIFHYLIRRKLHKYGEEQLLYNGERIKWVNQGLGGIKEVKVLTREDYFLGMFDDYNKRFAAAARNAMVLNQMPRLFIETLAIATLLLGIVAVIWGGGTAQDFFPTVALFAMAALRLLPSVNRILTSLIRIGNYWPALETVRKGLKGSTPEGSRGSTREQQRFSLQSSIEFLGVTYTYPSATKPALSGVTLTIPKGSSVAIVGPSGSGKTTLVDLLLGLLTPQTGCIRLDGQLMDNNLRSWQRVIGYIPQSIYLIDDTVRRNVAFGLPDALIEEDRVWKSLRMARLDEHVLSLPSKLDTVVGERGVTFSGGQRQRIGIARALYHDPDVLVLDEATSSLDAETEREIAETINQFQGKKTLLIIAHRTSTIEKCAIRYELQNGAPR